MASSHKEEDLTLNDKISKVIADIKRLNQMKAKEYGCSLDDTKNRSYKSEERTGKPKDKLIDFIKREKRKDDTLSQAMKQEMSELDDDELSSCFDLTSAKRPV